jgi:2-methylaconitate cis-trans-isomerase PrpF
MGTSDPLQIDGMGGSKHNTSKIVIVRLSTSDDADVSFTFAQVGVEKSTISCDGNCGNVSSGVGPFAVDEGIVKTHCKGHSTDESLSVCEVRIYNTGTKKLIIAHVPVDKKTGNSISAGDAGISGVPGAGAPILMDYRNVSKITLC